MPLLIFADELQSSRVSCVLEDPLREVHPLEDVVPPHKANKMGNSLLLHVQLHYRHTSSGKHSGQHLFLSLGSVQQQLM